jgi:leucyl-tRNA synthetase
LAEELWARLGGGKGLVALAEWPAFDPKLCEDDVVTMGVQVNGKMRGKIEVSINASEAEALEIAHQVASVNAALDGKKPTKVIYVPGRILNLIVK